METEHNHQAIFEMLADKTRREILKLLSGRRLAAGQIARRFAQQRPAISKHLTLLKRAGLLTEQRHRQSRLYSIRDGALQSVMAELETLRPCSPTDEQTPEIKRAPAASLLYQPNRRNTTHFDLEFD